MTAPVAGGTGTDTTGQPTADPNTQTGAAQGAPTGGTGTGATDPATQPGAQPAPAAPAPVDWEAVAKAAREEAAKTRIAGKAQIDKLTQDIGKALGLVKDDVADPAKLQEQLTARAAREAELANENLILRTAAAHGADPVKLADSRTFMTALGRLDATAADHAAQVAALITAHVEANPHAKLATAGPAGPVVPPPVNNTTAPGTATVPGGTPSDVDGFRKLLFGKG